MNTDGPTFWRSRLGFVSALIVVHLWLIPGCSSDLPTTRPASAADRQNAALHDPFGYSPDMDSTSNISGGGISELDRNAMKKDINNVLNP